MKFLLSVVRLFFDLLHGIKRMDVPLMVALEFAILLGYDGQLDQNSDMEKELFSSAIDQIKERFSIIFEFFWGEIFSKKKSREMK